MDFFEGLNKEQAAAVRHINGPLLVLAGAGSGKTRVIVHRIAYLIDQMRVPPQTILAITFTNKASKEMKSRIAKMLPDEAEALWIGTFHAMCVRILRRTIERVGYASNFTICDYDDQLSLIKECLKELNISDDQFAPRQVLDEIGRAKDELIDPEGYLRNIGSDFRKKKIHLIYELYQKKLKKNNSLDFDDIIMQTVRVFLEDESVLEYYQNKFKYVMVDEYQDTNTAQYNLVALLAGKWRNICVVGDDDQSIYGWRGANIKNILDFENYFVGARVIKLEQNYRSTKTILNAANSVIEKNVSRKRKELWTDNEGGSAVRYTMAEDEQSEARFVAEEAKRLRSESGASWNDSAILYRINAQSRAFENVLIREGIPYRIIGGLKFFDRKEIKDVVAYLRLIQNTSDDISLRRIINVPRRGIGNVTLEKLGVIAINESISMFEAAKRSGAYPELKAAHVKLKQFTDMIDSIIVQSSKLDVVGILDLTLKSVGIIRELEQENTEEAKVRIENIMELKSEIVDFERNYQSDDVFFFDEEQDSLNEQQNQGIGLREFLMHISLVSDIDNYEEEDERITLMTVHSAKGLEFSTVFLVGMEEGVFPGVRSFTDNNRIEEERRLCYVAITRARKLLYISHARSRTLFGNTTFNRLSRFIVDIPFELMEDATDRYYKHAGGARKIMSITETYEIGDRVQHKKYGHGIVTSRKNDGGDVIIEIYFAEAGLRRFIESMVELQKLQEM